MKKVFALMSIVAMFSMVACGPSKNHDEEAEKKRIEDSIKTADSIAAAQQQMEEEMNQQTEDTTATQDTTAAGTETEAPEAHEGH